MVVITYGSALRQFITDLIDIINTAIEWTGGGGSDTFGAKPVIDRKTDRKVTGIGKSKNELILIYSDNEAIKPFSIGVGVGRKDWYHTVSATIEVLNNTGEERFDQMVAAVLSTLREATNIKRTGYVQIIVGNYRNLSEVSRNKYRGIIDVRGELVNPSYDSTD